MSSALGNLAASIVSRLSGLVQETVTHETANGIIFDQCVELDARITLVKQSIELERKKQAVVKTQLARLRGQTVGGDPVALKSHGTPKKAKLAEDKENAADPDTSSLSQDSPVSLRTKRKGFVFDDEAQLRLAKRMKLAHDGFD